MDKVKEHLQLILFQTFGAEKKSYVDIITCNTDVYIEHAGFLNQQYLSLGTCIATMHNARGEFYNNNVLHLSIIPHFD